MLSCRGLAIAREGTVLQASMSFDLMPGRLYGLLGRNGTGKTTLLHTLAGLVSPHSGDIFLNNQNIKNISPMELSRSMTLMFQGENDSFPCDLMEYVLTSRYPHLATWQCISEADKAIAINALKRVGLWDMRYKKSHHLSGGQRRRLSLAAVLAQQTPVLLLDEPLAALDLHQQLQILDLLNEIARESAISILLSLHDVNLAARYTQALIFLFPEGQHRVGAKAELLHPQWLQALLGEEMLCQQGFWLPSKLKPKFRR